MCVGSSPLSRRALARGQNMSWGSWLRDQASSVVDGMKDFTDQLNEDTSEVREKAKEKLKEANEKLSQLVDADNLAHDAEVARAAFVAGRERASQLVEKVGLDGVMKGVEGALSGVEGALSGLARDASVARASRTVAASPVSVAAPQRFEEQRRALESNPSSFTNAPSDAAAFEAWCSKFDLLGRTSEIEQLLKSREGLHAAHSTLVPNVLSYRLFWQRYFWALEHLRENETRRLALLQRAAAPPPTKSLDSWGDLDEPSPPPRANAGRPASSASTAPQLPKKTAPVDDGWSWDDSSAKDSTAAAGLKVPRRPAPLTPGAKLAAVKELGTAYTSLAPLSPGAKLAAVKEPITAPGAEGESSNEPPSLSHEPPPAPPPPPPPPPPTTPASVTDPKLSAAPAAAPAGETSAMSSSTPSDLRPPSTIPPSAHPQELPRPPSTNPSIEASEEFSLVGSAIGSCGGSGGGSGGSEAGSNKASSMSSDGEVVSDPPLEVAAQDEEAATALRSDALVHEEEKAAAPVEIAPMDAEPAAPVTAAAAADDVSAAKKAAAGDDDWADWE